MKVAQELAKKLRKYEESVGKEPHRARHLKFDELSVQQERDPNTVSQFLTQIQDLRNRGEFLVRCKRFSQS